MGVRNYGNPPQFSTTAATVADPSTADVVAELILSTSGQPDNYDVRFGIGASTSAVWRLEHCTSSGLGSSAIAKQIVKFTGSNQTAEYVYTFRAAPGDRFRVRVNSTFTGTAAGVIQAEGLS
jgi:hypothetical protein